MADVTTFKPEVTYAWLSDPDHVFKNIAEDFTNGVVGNAFFPNSQTRATNAKALYLAYAPTVVEKDKQNSETSAARIAARTPLETELRLLLADVQAESGGDLARLLSTDAPLARYPESVQPAVKPEAVYFFLYGNPEQLYVQCDSQGTGSIYLARISDDDTNWNWISSDKKSAIGFTGLPAGIRLYAQMRVRNTVSEGQWSDSKPFMIPLSGMSIPNRKRPTGIR
ncbi:MAG: hypothetical protein GC192_01540 [Bacteroidetes bacterium]|nr:hypothetical protein [Bacteroidota bacterium]